MFFEVLMRNNFNILSLLFVISFGLLPNTCLTQNTKNYGRYPSKSFTNKDLPEPGQFSSTCQSEDGTLFFTTTASILSFDGSNWQKINTEVRKSKAENEILSNGSAWIIIKTKNDKILVGKSNNFGYLEVNTQGEYIYKAYKIATKENEIGDVYNIVELANEKYLYIAEKGLYLVDQGKVSKLNSPIPSTNTVKTSTELKKHVLLVSRHEETRVPTYYLFDKITLKTTKFQAPPHIELKNVRASFTKNDTTFLFDINLRTFYIIQKGNHYVWNDSKANPFPELNIYNVVHLVEHKNSLFVATDGNGVLEVDKFSGKINRIYNDLDNLQDLVVNYLFFDKLENLWCLQDIGVHFLELSSPITSFSKLDGIKAANLLNISFVNQMPIIATTSGLYSSRKENNNYIFENSNLLNEACFQVSEYQISPTIKKTIAVAGSAIFEIDITSGKTTFICDFYAWIIEQSKIDPTIFYVGLEDGLGQISYVNGTWESKILMEVPESKSISIAQQGNKVYFTSEKDGFFEYDILTKTHVKYTIDPKSLFSNDKEKIARIKKEMIGASYYLSVSNNLLFIGTTFGLYTFDFKTHSIKPFDLISTKFGEYFTITRLSPINNKLWISAEIRTPIKDKKTTFETGYLEFIKGKYHWTSWPLSFFGNTSVILGIAQGSENKTWLSASDCIYIYNEKKIKNLLKPFKTFISKIANAGTVITYNVTHKQLDEVIDFKGNKLSFTFHTDIFLAGSMLFKYRLNGYNDWSDWSNLNTANFEKLTEGTYTLEVISKNIYNQESVPCVFVFTISPPWFRSWWAYTLYIVIGILIIIGITKLSTQRVVSQNIRLESTVKERTQEIEHQKEEIEKKNNDILDSIIYAKRIQQTILPAEDKLKRHFNEHFVFYRPKDIVSGDFYFSKQIESKIIFAAVDCTGHGVPGALVSIVGNNGLLRATNEFRLSKPSEILDKLREIVITSFRAQGQSDVKDGMDISLCSYDKETLMLEFAGANNECIIIRENEMIELKPDKQPIGQYINPKPFTNHSFQLEKGDCVYLFTDGFVDQFGGPREKKYMSRNLKNLLLDMNSTTNNKNMVQQFITIQEEFDNWKGDLDQIDDVCVFGIKI
jgi:serine phosphatase RsbU (regulator of sigma subunit)